MNLKLMRKEFGENGIFGELTSGDGFRLETLEHPYFSPLIGCAPKLPPGKYTCKRGPHRLASMSHDFETFEVTGVEGHTGILFHVGNYSKDSNGCILLGLRRSGYMITNSKIAFNDFMEALKGLNEFTLEVSND